MAENVALTTIRHGKEDGTVVVIEEGEKVTGLPSDVVKDLKEQGLVGSPAMTPSEVDEEKAELQAKIDELNAQLAEAQAANTAKQQASTPPAAPTK
jgi:hypothetical protein